MEYEYKIETVESCEDLDELMLRKVNESGADGYRFCFALPDPGFPTRIYLFYERPIR